MVVFQERMKNNKWIMKSTSNYRSINIFPKINIKARRKLKQEINPIDNQTIQLGKIETHLLYSDSFKNKFPVIFRNIL